MTEICSTGTWRPKAGREQEFIAAWSVFAGWAGGMPGAGTLRLTRDDGDPGRFVSFGVWQSDEAVRAWKTSPDFRGRIGRVLEHVDVFDPRELTVVATATSDVKATPTQAGGSR